MTSQSGIACVEFSPTAPPTVDLLLSVTSIKLSMVHDCSIGQTHRKESDRLLGRGIDRTFRRNLIYATQ